MKGLGEGEEEQQRGLHGRLKRGSPVVIEVEQVKICFKGKM